MQTRTQSLIEATANTLLTIVIGVITQIIVFPWFGLNATIVQNLWIVLIFTAISFVRSFLVRRFFNWYQS